MCDSRPNGTIYRECRDDVFHKVGTHRITNKEMRVVINLHGGCMNDKVDMHRKSVVMSNRR